MKNKKISKSYQIETEHFYLRIPNQEDIPLVLSATQFEGFNDGMQWEAPEDQTELVNALDRNIKAWENGHGFSFTIVRKGTTNLLGRISIRQTEKEDNWNIGFWTHPEVQRNGIMTEVLAAVLKFGFEELSAIRIEAYHAKWNIASEKVLKKNGMRFVRYIEKGFQKKGQWIEEHLLAIDKEN